MTSAARCTATVDRRPLAHRSRAQPRRRLRPLATLLTLALAAGACSAAHPATGVTTHPGSTATTTTTRGHGSTSTSGGAHHGASTWLGPDGVESAAVIAENAKKGTAEWRIADQGPGFIEGFADRNYVADGDSTRLFVSTDAPTFTVTAYRMGWYQGLGARQIWASAAVPGVDQPTCPIDRATNMVSCANWAASITMRVTDAFVPGDYLLKLVGAGGQQGYVLLTVWDPSSTAAYLVMNRSLVEQGWNTFGGYDYYQGEGGCILDSYTYPPCNRARVVSFDRPFDTDGSSDFLTNEYPLVQFAEQEGLDVTYCTDICISEHPTFLLQHKALIALDHDETWTNSERVGVLQAAGSGVNMAFLGAATFVRHARLEASPLGPDRQEVDYRNADEDPLNGHGDPADVTGNTWEAGPAPWDPSAFLGQIYSGFLEPNEPSAAIVVSDAGAWIWKGAGLRNGDKIPAAINSDIDHIDPSGPIPADLQVLAHSPIPLSQSYTNQGEWNGYTYSDMTYYTSPASKAGVFDSGDNVWVAALSPCPTSPANCPSQLARKVTANLLWLFGQGPAGKLQPSVANWRSVTPAGS